MQEKFYSIVKFFLQQ